VEGDSSAFASRRETIPPRRHMQKAIGVGDVVEWHDVVPFDTLEQYFISADVVVEQLGSHWIGQGLFAMAMGKPVIGRLANRKANRVFFGQRFVDRG